MADLLRVSSFEDLFVERGLDLHAEVKRSRPTIRIREHAGASSGTARVMDWDTRRDERRARARTSVVFGGTGGLYGQLSARRNLRYFATLSGVRRRGPLLRFKSGIGIAGPDRGFRVSPGAARLWLGLGGSRTLDEIGADGTAARKGVRHLLDFGAADAIVA